MLRKINIFPRGTFFLKILFIYLSERESAHKQGEQQAGGEGEAVSLLSKEPNVGLDPIMT